MSDTVTRPIRRRAALWGAVALTLATAVASLAWWIRGAVPGSPPAVGAPRAGTGPAQSVVIVTIDGLRADADLVSLAALARDGTRFTRAYTTAPVTLPAHASLLTGRLPPAHGARHDGLQLRDGVTTMAAALRDRGLATGAFVSAARLAARYGLAAGFDTYDGRLSRNADGRMRETRPAADTVTAALSWLGAHRDRPFFVWVQLAGPPGTDVEPAHVEADREVHRLIDGLGPTRARTLVVVTSPHGRAQGEHGEWDHGVFLYDTTVRVPLLLAGPGVSRGVTDETPVSLVDVAPTVAALLGAPWPSTGGLDLLRVASGGVASAPRALYAETFAPLLDFGWSPLRTVRVGEWKLVEAPVVELFDLDADPEESRNLAGERPEEVRRLTADLEAFGSGSLTLRFGLDAEVAARLGMGATERPPVGRDQSRPLADPKSRREIAARLARLRAEEMPAERIEVELRGVVRADPLNPTAQLLLGSSLAARGDCLAAAPHLRAAIAAPIPSAKPYLSLATCLEAGGDHTAARNVLLAARKVDQGHPEVEARLGRLAFEHGRFEEAIEALGVAVRAEPDQHDARLMLARALARVGRLPAAREHVRALLASLPAGDPRRAAGQRLADTLR